MSFAVEASMIAGDLYEAPMGLYKVLFYGGRKGTEETCLNITSLHISLALNV